MLRCGGADPDQTGLIRFVWRVVIFVGHHGQLSSYEYGLPKGFARGIMRDRLFLKLWWSFPMRIDGVLTKWNDDRGFGFITPAQGGSEIFVHVSKFPRDGQRPRVGERLSFEIETENNGKKRATNLVCLERQVQQATRRHMLPHRSKERSAFWRFMQFAIVVALIAYGYAEYSGRTAPGSIVTSRPIEQTASEVFQCDGRTHCSQMTSCAEATYFLKNCPGVKMDGNHDGVPCEQQWCSR